MARADTRSLDPIPARNRTRAPSVLVVLVVRDGAQWLPQCLLALSRQTHPRIGVLAIDNGSADGSGGLLESALGSERVIRLPENRGFGAAVREALASKLAPSADFVLLLHDDTALAPDAVQRLVEAAERTDGVGVVGPKVLDWEREDLLREVGSSIDRFGHAYSPLEEGEIDQGQYDRLRDVLFVSSVAMLISREAWTKVGPPDERFSSYHDGLDFCWRARLAGFRVLMTPGAVVRHRGATVRGERRDGADAGRRRYHRERGALASMLKNYSLGSLTWILPFYFGQALARMAILALARRLDEAYQVAAAWGWNLRHLPDTLSRRRRIQKLRTVPDRVVRRSMAPSWIRLRRWGAAAGEALLPAWVEAAEAGVPLRSRLADLAVRHPPVVVVALGTLLALVAYRGLMTASPLIGGGLGLPPDSPQGYFSEFASAVRHTGFGGAQHGGPALALLGLGSLLALGSPALLQKILLLALPAAAAIGCYRAARTLTEDRAAAVVAGGAYGLSTVVLWAQSSGRLGALVFLAGAPWLASKLSLAFEEGLARRVPVHRWVVGAAAGLAALSSFFPGALLGGGLVVAASLLTPARGVRRLGGTILCVGAAAIAGLLTLPQSLDLARTDGAALGALLPHRSFSSLLRLALGPGPGSWWVALYLPVAAAIGLAFGPASRGRATIRAAVLGVSGVYLAWAASAGYLPRAAANPVAYLGPAALGFSLLVAAGLAALVPGLTRRSFGHRQLAAGAMVGLVGVGLLGQAFQFARGDREVGGEDRIPAAYPIITDAGEGPFRVLWLGSVDGDAFPSPGGLPDGRVSVGKLSLRYAVRDRAGATDLDTGRAAWGAGYDALEEALARILEGGTRHGGALLAPLGIRFVVAVPDDVPEPVWTRLIRQLDLDVVATAGLRILENPKAVPLASVITDPEWVQAVGTGRSETAELPRLLRLPTEVPSLSQEAPAGSMVFRSSEFDERWRLYPADGGPVLRPTRAFGWATAFLIGESPVPAGSRISFVGQGAHTLLLALVAAGWGAAIVFTRKPARRG